MSSSPAPSDRDAHVAATPSPPEADRYRNALIEVHEFQCGCALLDPAECVCSPPVVFEALRDPHEVYVRGSSTITAACTCESPLAGFHATNCGVFK